MQAPSSHVCPVPPFHISITFVCQTAQTTRWRLPARRSSRTPTMGNLQLNLEKRLTDSGLSLTFKEEGSFELGVKCIT